jgi:hypothetical protein
MAIFEDWCEFECTDKDTNRLWSLEEKGGGRAAIRARLIQTVRSHYDDLQRIADDVQQLGYDGAAAVLRERLPTTKKARSGEFGRSLLRSDFIVFASGHFRRKLHRVNVLRGVA